MNILSKPIIYVCLYIIVLGILSITRHFLFHTYAFDLGIFIQALYTTWSEKRMMFETPDSLISESYLGIHFSPILFLLVPLVIFFPPAETLLLLQTVTLAVPAYFLYKEVYIKKGSEGLATLVSTWYLLNPALHSVNLDDFHTQSLMILPAYLLIKELKRRNIIKSAMLLLLLFTISEQALFIGLGCILYILLEFVNRKRTWMKGLIVIVFITTLMSVAAFVTISIFGKPPVDPKNPTKFFPQLGSTWAEVLRNMFSWKLIEAVKHDIVIKVSYWLVLMFPLYIYNWKIVLRDVIPVLSPWIIFTFISGYAPFYTLGWHFNGLVLGVIAAAAPEVVKRFSESGRNLKKHFITLAALAILLSPVSVVPYYFSDLLYIPRGGAYKPISSNISDELEIATTIKTALSLIPQNASILCTSNIFPHVATRSNAYVGNVGDVEYILIDYRYVNLEYFNQRFLRLVSELNESYKYGVVMFANGILLLKKNYTSHPLLFKQYEVRIDPNRLYWKEVVPKFNDKGYVLLDFSLEDEKMVWYGPYVTLPPGLYEVEVAASGNFVGKLTIEVTNFIDNGRRLTISADKTFYIRIPTDNLIEIKGYLKGIGNLTLHGIYLKLIKI